jgi:hypothetical protein
VQTGKGAEAGHNVADEAKGKPIVDIAVRPDKIYRQVRSQGVERHPSAQGDSFHQRGLFIRSAKALSQSSRQNRQAKSLKHPRPLPNYKISRL